MKQGLRERSRQKIAGKEMEAKALRSDWNTERKGMVEVWVGREHSRKKNLYTMGAWAPINEALGTMLKVLAELQSGDPSETLGTNFLSVKGGGFHSTDSLGGRV